MTVLCCALCCAVLWTMLASHFPLLLPAGADLGIVFDTDVDRSAVVDADGTPINSNRFIALMAAIVLQVPLALMVVADKLAGSAPAAAAAAHTLLFVLCLLQGLMRH